jgi:bacillopeptidase F
MKRLVLIGLYGLLVITLTSSEIRAGVIGPEAQSVMKSVGAKGEIPVVVTFKEQADISPFAQLPKAARRSRIVKTLREKADVTQKPVREFLESRGVRKTEKLWLINAMAVTASAEVIQELAGRPDVEEIAIDHIFPAFEVNYSPSAVAEWNIDAIHAGQMWRRGYYGQQVVVANMDTGVDYKHPDLKRTWRGGKNSWYDPYGEHSLPFDSPASGHGTMTMGVMVGGNSSGTSIGVAPGAKWIAVKIFNDNGFATDSAVHKGFQWLMDPDKDPDTDDAPDVVNNSWGSESPECSQIFQRDINRMRAAGIAVVFSAGNKGPGASSCSDPADNPRAFSAGSTTQSNLISSFSSRGPSLCDGRIFPDVVAPGQSIRTSTPLSTGRRYASVNGTSFSSPHTAGAMALLLSGYPGLSVSQLEQALVRSATDLGGAGPDNTYGYGLINVSGAYAFIRSQTKEMTLASQKGFDGWVRESSENSRVGGTFRKDMDFYVGDDKRNLQYKTILSFDTSSIPRNAVITSAKLFLRRKGIAGANPFGSLKSCLVDVMETKTSTLTLQNSDFQSPAGCKGATAMTSPAKNGSQSTGFFSDTGLKAINKGGITQLRVYFSKPTNNNNAQNMMVFWGDSGTTDQRPKLLITYMLP